MAKIAVSKNKKKRRGLGIFACILLLAAAGAVLYGIPPFLLDISRIIRTAAGNFSSRQPAGQAPAPAVLRGTIYDQGFNELAVTYRLYILRARPADLNDYKATAEALAQVIGRNAADIEGILKSSRQTVTIMDDLDESQAAAIEALALPGVLCMPVENRFYPAHTAASHVLGFMGDGAGLAGLEGRYDAVLSARAVRRDSLPDFDLEGRETLGEPVDLILTLDLRLQRRLEQLLREYLTAQGMNKGMGLLLEPGSGRILALANQPSFNPNYFWMAKEGSRENRIYSQLLDSDLIRPILVRAAAIERDGIDGPPLLPTTVAAPDYGFNESMLEGFAHRIRLHDPVSDSWEGGASQEKQEGRRDAVTGVQIGATLASLVNGGWRINPYVVDSLYDHAAGLRFHRKEGGAGRAHVLDPALSVKVRRTLLSDWVSAQDDKILYKAEKARGGFAGDSGGYRVQSLFAGLAPAGYPQYLLVLAVEQDELQPSQPGPGSGNRAGKKGKKADPLVQLGRNMLDYAAKNPPQGTARAVPPSRNEENMQQFFISRRHAETRTAEELAIRAATMPSLRGLSLRRALREIDPYKMKVNIQGSGRVVAQYPLAGASLLGANECMLTLGEP